MKWKIATVAIWMQVLCNVLFAGEMVRPDTLGFGPVRIATQVVDTVRVGNPAAEDLLVDSVRVQGTGFELAAAPFSGSVLVLSAQAEAEVLVRFTPLDTVAYEGALELSTDRGPLAVPLRGEGRREVVVINEILADPASGESGDANGDGTRHSNEDEFVELLNTGLRPVYLGGTQLSDRGASGAKRFTFPEGTWIAPGERVVLFGGGSPQGIPGQVFVDDGRIGGGLSNSGDAVFLIDPAGPDTLARAAYGSEGGKDKSLVREPEGTGELAPHTDFPGNGERFSPGRARVRASGVFVVPADTTVELGATVRPEAWLAYSDGSRLEILEDLSWTVSDSSVLRLQEGEFVAAGVGECLVRAVYGTTASDFARFAVSAPGLTGLELTPPETLIVVGDSVAFSVWGMYSDGVRTPLGGGLAWATSNPLIATVAEDRITAGGPGLCTVTAALEDLWGSATLRAATSGDLNADGVFDLLDALRTVHLILEIPPEPTGFERRASDLNRDGETDILDLSRLIRRMLGKPEVASRVARVEPGTWEVEGNRLRVRSPVAVSALELRLEGTIERIEPESGVGGQAQAVQGLDGKWHVLLYGISEEGLGPEMSFVFTPRNAHPGRIEAFGVSLTGAMVRFQENAAVPDRVRLGQNHPNPFNASTVLRYELPDDAEVDLRIFSCLGQEVSSLADGPRPAGIHEVRWDGMDRRGRPAGSGMYLARLVAGQTQSVIKMVLLR